MLSFMTRSNNLNLTRMTTAMPRFVLFAIAMVSIMLGCIPGSFAAKDYQEAGLEQNNMYRERHIDTPPMTLDENLNELADKCAEFYANQDKMGHNCPYIMRNVHGENLAGAVKTMSLAEAVKDAVNRWYGEIEKWEFEKSSWKKGLDWKKIGHFTQVVWKGSIKLGIGAFKKEEATWTYVVGLYSPPGNMNIEKENSKEVKENVLCLKANCTTGNPSSGGGTDTGPGIGPNENGPTTPPEVPAGAKQVSFFEAAWTHFICMALLLSFGMIV